MSDKSEASSQDETFKKYADIFIELVKELHPFLSSSDLITEDKNFVAKLEKLKRPRKIKSLSKEGLFDNSDGLFKSGKLFDPESERYFYLLDYSFDFPHERLWQSEYRDLSLVAEYFSDMPFLRENIYTVYIHLKSQVWNSEELNLLSAITNTQLSLQMVEAVLDYENYFASINNGIFPNGSFNGLVSSAIKLHSNLHMGYSQAISSALKAIKDADDWVDSIGPIELVNTPRDARPIFKRFPEPDKLPEILSQYGDLREKFNFLVKTKFEELKTSLQKHVNDGDRDSEEKKQIHEIWNTYGQNFQYVGDCSAVKLYSKGPFIIKGKKQRQILELLVRAGRNSPVSLERILSEVAPERDARNSKISDYFKDHFLQKHIKYTQEMNGYYLDFDEK